MDRRKINKMAKDHPASAPPDKPGTPLQLLHGRMTIETMLTTKFALAIGLAGSAIVAALLPLLSLTNGAALGPPYTLDEAVQLVQTEMTGTVVRAETLPANSGITSRGVPGAGASQDDCPCAEDGTEEGAEDPTTSNTSEDNNVQSRGLAEPATAKVHSIRILRPDGTVSTILVDEQRGIVTAGDTQQTSPKEKSANMPVQEDK